MAATRTRQRPATHSGTAGRTRCCSRGRCWRYHRPVALVSPQGDMSGLALYHLPFGTGDEAEMRALMPLDLMGILVGWLVARLALRV